jgi:hypothetical protein
MRAVLSRTYRQLVTTGCLFVFDGDRAVLNVKTMELPDKGNQSKISCIPAGEYECTKVKSPTKNKQVGYWVYLLHGVPQRSAVLIHIGNYATGVKVDTEGCILVGLRFVDMNEDGQLDIADSTVAMKMLLAVLPESFKLTIL